MTQDEMNLLKSVAIFSAIPKEGLKLLWDSADSRRLRPSEVLFMQGQKADSGFLVLRGSLLLTTTPHSQDIYLHKGEFVGEMALISEQRRQATCLSREESQILKISSSAYLKILSLFPEAAIHASQIIQGRLNTLMLSLDVVRQQIEDIH